MKRLFASALCAGTLSALTAMPAQAARLPAIVATSQNAVPACVTPGRLMALTRQRNPRLSPQFKDIAVHYMRHGEELGIRWDYAYFQMLLETNYLRYTGDVSASQNNFAGLGATGGGVPGERFRTVSDGVRGHLEHVLMYTGAYIDNPVADRTRKVQAWGVLDKWRRSIRGPMTYEHIGRQWAPSDRGYGNDIAAIAVRFFNNHCNAADPQPELLARARGRTNSARKVASDQTARKVANARRDSLGAALNPSPNARRTAANTARKTVSTANVTVLNAAPASGSKAKTASPNTKIATLSPGGFAGAGAKADTKPNARTDSRRGGSQDATGRTAKPAVAPPGSCRVWQASYGGSRALIIKAVKKGVTNYTVLDVNAGREKREADAYIAAYAKGGETIKEFRSPKDALAHAFKLCPEK